MERPTHCVQHDRAITPESWSLFERSIHLGRYDECACGISEDEREALRYEDLCKEREALKAPNRKAVGSSESDEEYWYFITITQPDSNKDWDRILKATEKFIKSKQIGMLEWAYCLEYTKSLTPHSHIRCKSKRSFLDRSKLMKLNDNYRIDVPRETFGSNAYISNPEKLHPDRKWFFCSDNYSGTRPEV